MNKKFLTRLRDEDNSMVLLEVSFDEREMLMEAEPATFHFTPHYKDYPSVLARLVTDAETARRLSDALMEAFDPGETAVAAFEDCTGDDQGGKDRPIAWTVEAHANTFLMAAEIYSKFK